MLKFTFNIIFLLFIWSVPNYAQEKTEEDPELHILLPEDIKEGDSFLGYIVLNSGDTLQGEIGIESLEQHEMAHGFSFPIIKEINFKDQWGDTFFIPDSLRGFALKRDYPIATYKNLSCFDQKYMHFDSKRSLNAHKTGYNQLFLQRLLDGVVQVYEIPYMEVIEDNVADDKIVKNLHYLINKDDSDFWDVGVNNCYQLIPLLFGDSKQTNLFLEKHSNWFDISHLPILIDYYNTHQYKKKWKTNVHGF